MIDAALVLVIYAHMLEHKARFARGRETKDLELHSIIRGNCDTNWNPESPFEKWSTV